MITHKKKKSFTLQQHETINGYIFIMPFLLVFVLFTVVPTVLGLAVSLVDMKFITVSISKLKFVGLDNFIKVFHDKEYWASIYRTIYYMILFVPSIMILGIITAYFVNSRTYFKNLIRTSLFLPYISNIVSIALVWAIMYDFQDGPINMILKVFGVQNPPLWLLGDTAIVIPSICAVAVWHELGFYFVTFLAALQGVPKELYESADLDGANERQKLLKITVPYLMPTTYFLFMVAILGSLGNFSIVKTMTEGGPGFESTTIGLYNYNTAFISNQMSRSVAQGLIFSIFPMFIIFLSRRMQKDV